jgi:SHS family lactate transporter-like MFS transporter
MSLREDYASLSGSQRTVIWASYLGWTLDAFDFFLLVFMLKAISTSFGVKVSDVSAALFLTLAARPLGALAFGWLGDRFGRRPVLIAVILAFSFFSALSGFARDLGELLLIRALFGFAMGGEWGLGASLAMESIPARMRGPVSGLLQSGYPSGFLLASLAYFLFFDALGWRLMFLLGLAPALLVLFIRMKVEESPVFLARKHEPKSIPLVAIGKHWQLALYLIVLMTAFTSFSHGTQDLYPTFLQKQHGFSTQTTGAVTVFMNIGAICGALVFGSLSERMGRRRAIMCAALLAVPVLPVWAFSQSVLMLALGAFAMQFAVQGAWGMVPADLNELSPPTIRATFPGLVYQLGNLLSSALGPFQATVAERRGDDYGFALALVAALSITVLVIWTAFGPERKQEFE